jgi:hypothetical protein
MYIAVATRADIAYSIKKLAPYLGCYRLEQWETAIRVLRYLKGTHLVALVLGETNPLRLIGYSDSDYANCANTSQSICGYSYMLGSGTVSWCSRKRRTVANLSCYAEYIALHSVIIL